jgi:glycosyltransferase involved in cell wall biosynthesis
VPVWRGPRARLGVGSQPAPLKVTVSVGPGPYAEDLVEQLAAHGVLDRVIYSWPAPAVHRWSPENKRLERERSLPLYELLVRTIWATWNRIPVLGRHRTPQSLINTVFDVWARGLVGNPDLLLAWAQVSLHSLRAARARGITTVLEHPMMHVDLWQELMREEYARHGSRAALTFSLRPESMVRRMKAEYEAADAIVVPAVAARQSFLDRGISSDRIALVPFGVRADRFSPGDAAGRAGPFRLLYVGRLELLKGVHYLLEAWRRQPVGEAELWLVGPVLPELAPILARTARSDVKVLGEVGRDEVAQYYRQVDALVFPSLCEGFGIVILEAMASGLPVLTTSHTGGPDVIDEGQTGFVVPIRDADALADRIAWLRAHRGELPEMGRAARARVMAKFTLDEYGARLVSAYQGIRERRRARPGNGEGKGGRRD